MNQFYNQNMNMNPQVVYKKEKDDDIYKNVSRRYLSIYKGTKKRNYYWIIQYY